MRPLLRTLVATALVAGSFGAAHAWNATGHMVIAAIAQSGLTPTARAEADRLLKVAPEGIATEFLLVASWADETRAKETAAWHYADHHFRTDGKPDNQGPEPENAVWAIEKFSKVLADKSKPDGQRAEALRYLIHFVGDLHQPLHATARDTDAHPTGDRGGNDFHIADIPEFANMERPPRNLHSLWDLGAGLFMPDATLKSLEGQQRARLQAFTLMAALPRESLGKIADPDPEHWALESFEDAKKVTYATTEDAVPTDDYLIRSRAVAARRATLAGYRLSDLLNRILK